MPPLIEGQPLDGRFEPLAKKTQPPRRYTEATLLSAMESAGKTLTDDELRAAMKDTGLGTPATRAAIIETLLKRGYAQRDKKLVIPTATGMGLIDALPVQSLASPELTGTWEARLARIARGEETRLAFMTDIATYVRDTVADDPGRGAGSRSDREGGCNGGRALSTLPRSRTRRVALVRLLISVRFRHAEKSRRPGDQRKAGFSAAGEATQRGAARLPFQGRQEVRRGPCARRRWQPPVRVRWSAW